MMAAPCLVQASCDADARASTAAATATRAGGDAQGQARTPGPRWAAASRPGANAHPPSSFRRGYIPASRGPRVAVLRLGAGLASGTPGTPTGPARPEQSAGSREGARECRLHGRDKKNHKPQAGPVQHGNVTPPTPGLRWLVMENVNPAGRIIEWLPSDNMHHQWLLLAACFWVIFMFMVASKFITLTFKDPDGYSAKQEFVSLTTMPEAGKLKGEKHLPENTKPTGRMLSDGRPDQPPVYLERLELIRNACQEEALRNLSHTEVSKFVLDRIFVCDKHKILFCQTPKVGNTQWKKVLIVLNGAFSSIEEIPENVVHDHEKNGLPRLSSFSKTGIQKRLKTYFKFFIVRDPFERLISAFKDKFVHNPRFEPWYRHEIAPGIIRKYRKNRTETRGIQFEDFVRYLGDPNRRWLDLQFGDHIIHWVTYVELCAPCEIKYSVIGHHETLEEDAPYILKEAGIDHLVSYPTIPPGITLYNRTKVEHYFLGISKRDIRRLYARFEGDFKLFGYQKPEFLLN